ncbi:MAG: M48 family metallopeptidase [Ktedonobacteraceae bacterium]|nr:M48 family metallopeptidase [Ktedonobacteraceae bacterium]MBO0794761.1 M48 family metallopeptidase [Ktedonobacteraceae bacterium]
MSTVQPGARKRFPGLDASALQHPYDRAALNALQKVPGLDIIIRKFIELLPERVAYIQNVAQSVKVTSTQCPNLYASLQEACTILDMPEPELYVLNYPVPNAWTSGHDHPYIVVTTGLLDLMNEDEILAVIAHELGHIKSGHVLYKTMARGISFLLQLIGNMTLGIGQLVGRTLEAALLEWDRKSEFSADRAALLVVQDPQITLSLMMKFAGGTLFQRDQMNAQEFLKQADLYEEVDANMLDRMYKLLMVTSVSHPLIIVRAKELMNWSESTTYKGILDGFYPRTPVFGANGSGPDGATGGVLIHCPHCGREQTNRRFCSLCGGEIS